MVSFKLCYYGNGRDVTAPLAWIIKSEREVAGSRAQCPGPLCPPHLEEEPKGRSTGVLNWFSQNAPCLQAPSKRQETLELEEAHSVARVLELIEQSVGSQAWNSESFLSILFFIYWATLVHILT